MKRSKQYGSSILIAIIVLVLLVIVGGIYVYRKDKKANQIIQPTAISLIDNNGVYSNDKFSVRIPSGYKLYIPGLNKFELMPATPDNSSTSLSFFIAKTNDNEDPANTLVSIALTPISETSTNTLEKIFKQDSEYDGPVNGIGTYSPKHKAKMTVFNNQPAVEVVYDDEAMPFYSTQYEFIKNSYVYVISYNQKSSDSATAIKTLQSIMIK